MLNAFFQIAFYLFQVTYFSCIFIPKHIIIHIFIDKPGGNSARCEKYSKEPDFSRSLIRFTL